MIKDPYAHSYIDHFIQAEIVSRLATAEHAVRFSELKEDGIENSLFMYHTNKLITRGLVQKSDDGFSLTIKGARWANYTGVFQGSISVTPRLLVQFVIKNSEGQILLSMRQGKLRQLLNDYLLPGSIYQYGIPLEENVRLILKDFFGDAFMSKASQLTTADVIHEFEDGFVHHAISYIFTINLPKGSSPTVKPYPLFDLIWVSLDAIKIDNPQFEKSTFLPMFFERAPSLKSHETFVIKSK